MLGFISGQLSELNWLMEGMKNTRTGLRRSGAPCVKGRESRGKKRQGGKGRQRERAVSLSETTSSWIFCAHVTGKWHLKPEPQVSVCLASILLVDFGYICLIGSLGDKSMVRAGCRVVPQHNFASSVKCAFCFLLFSRIKIRGCRSQNLQIRRGQFCRWHCADSWCPSHSLHWMQNLPLQKRNSVQNHVSSQGVVPWPFITSLTGEKENQLGRMNSDTLV